MTATPTQCECPPESADEFNERVGWERKPGKETTKQLLDDYRTLIDLSGRQKSLEEAANYHANEALKWWRNRPCCGCHCCCCRCRPWYYDNNVWCVSIEPTF